MRNNKQCKSESQQAHQFNANPIQLILGLCVVLGVSSISVRANDKPAQAAARVALEQKMYELDHPQTLPPPAQVTRSEVVVKQQPGKSAANVTGTVSQKAVTPQTAPAPIILVAAPTAVAPAAAAPAVVAPAAVTHHMLILILSFLLLSCIILSLLLLKVLLQNSRSNQDSTSSGAYNVQANPVTLRLKTGNR
jgi:hypothetical protein